MTVTHKVLLIASTLLVSSAVPFASGRTEATACESLSTLKLADTTITMAQAVAAGTFTAPRGGGGKPVPVAFCRVAGSIKPKSDSDIKFELWLPAAGWTGRYESVGNGGFAGSIRYDSMLNPLLGGSAVASTDDGHSGGGAAWALGHPEKVIDYGYRAVHLTADISKELTTAFYGDKPKHSYFVGCSKGGQEAFMEAQRYPDDFDGILGAAAANQWIGLFSSFAWAQQTNLANKEAYVSPEDLVKIGSALAACDAADGVKDGLISNPLACKVDPSALALTPSQIQTYQAFHTGPKDKSGKSVYPGQAYGSETVSWRGSITGTSFDDGGARASQTMYANGFFANFVYQNASWTFRDFDINKSPADALKAVGQIMNSDKLDFTAFKKHGGKLIQLHGLSDSLVTPLGSVAYYSKVVGESGGKMDARALAKTQESYRLFLAPGVDHCGGGPGPNQFGLAGGNGDADHDIVSALYQWVEKGTAPEKVVATKFIDNNDPSRGTAMTRPICAYPKVAKYKGTGDSNDAASFTCAP